MTRSNGRTAQLGRGRPRNNDSRFAVPDEPEWFWFAGNLTLRRTAGQRIELQERFFPAQDHSFNATELPSHEAPFGIPIQRCRVRAGEVLQLNPMAALQAAVIQQ